MVGEVYSVKSVWLRISNIPLDMYVVVGALIAGNAHSQNLTW